MRLESQGVSTVPSVEHSLAPTDGQLQELQASPTHVRSHAQALSHVMSSHALSPVHVMSHLLPPPHRMSLQAPPPMQEIVHVQPDGQSMVPAQSSALVQLTWQVFAPSSHDVQSSGHDETTQ